MASAAARYWPTAKAAITAMQRAISAEMPLHQGGDGVVEGLVPGQQGDGDGGIHAENSLDDAQPVEEQQHADESGKGVVADSFPAVLVHGEITRDLAEE